MAFPDLGAWRGLFNAMVVLAGSFVLGSGAPPAGIVEEPPEQIVIKPARSKRVARPEASSPSAREVSIGFLVRGPEERGSGPQIHSPYSPFPNYATSYTPPNDLPILDTGIFRALSSVGGDGLGAGVCPTKRVDSCRCG